jgi:hypothetical protein
MFVSGNGLTVGEGPCLQDLMEGREELLEVSVEGPKVLVLLCERLVKFLIGSQDPIGQV